MKTDPSKTLIAKLTRIKEEIDLLAQPETKAEFLNNLSELIVALNDLRGGLTSSALEAKAAAIRRPLEEVIGFLEFAKSDDTLRTLLSRARKSVTSKPKRPAIEIPNNLTNEQIRAFLEKDLSRAELKAIASQRSISIGKSNSREIKRDILKNLERQEGYERLSHP